MDNKKRRLRIYGGKRNGTSGSKIRTAYANDTFSA